MVELFRYIQRSLPARREYVAIDLDLRTDHQQRLHRLARAGLPPNRLRSAAQDFLAQHFPQANFAAVAMAHEYEALAARLHGESGQTFGQATQDVFGTAAHVVVSLAAFEQDKALLSDALISVKLTSAFDRPGAARLAGMRRVIALLETVAASPAEPEPDAVRLGLRRPLRVPQALLDALRPRPHAKQAGGGEAVAAPDPLAGLLAEQLELKAAYERIMSLPPTQFVLADPAAAASERSNLTSPAPPGLAARRAETAAEGEEAGGEDTVSEPGPKEVLVLPSRVAKALGPSVRRRLACDGLDAERTPVADVVAALKHRWQEVSLELAPVQAPPPVPVFRVGAHLFGIAGPVATVPLAGGAPAALGTATPPVGVGDLLVVRQELLGYEPGAISHVENVLEHELMRRVTRREEGTELLTVEELVSTRSEERDQQSTTRNELATEAQQEASRQAVSVQGATTTTEYGRLIENSKTGYARSVTDRAVNTVSQTTRQQRTRRETRSFAEEGFHEFDNRERTGKIRGIYQWLDQRFRTSVLNYGRRLLYDVVVPEPAAMLISALRTAPQPENFRLVKPLEPGIGPGDLNVGNYMVYAARYGVTGAVAPPPEEFEVTVAEVGAILDVPGRIDPFGGAFLRNHMQALKIQLPDGHRAVAGYVQRTDLQGKPPSGRRLLEFFIGGRTFVRFKEGGYLNENFTLNGEAGFLPVTLRSFSPVVQFNFAIGIHCRRTDAPYRQWQLKTHAAIMAGYQRQFAEYLDRLGQYQAAVRAQMAMTGGARDDATERNELKRAFIFLLLGEQFGQAFRATPEPELLPPDPAEVREWGAMVAFFERAFEWENMVFSYYPYFWGRSARWGELVLIQDLDPRFEAFLKAGAARVVVPVRPGFEAALAHFQETGEIWMGQEMPDLFGDLYVSIIDEIRGRNASPGEEVCVEQWDVSLPTTLILLREDAALPTWTPKIQPPPDNPA